MYNSTCNIFVSQLSLHIDHEKGPVQQSSKVSQREVTGTRPSRAGIRQVATQGKAPSCYTCPTNCPQSGCKLTVRNRCRNTTKKTCLFLRLILQPYLVLMSLWL